MKKVVFLIVMSSLLFNSCKKDENPVTPVNHKPNIVSVTANPVAIKTDEQTTLTCVATDEDRDNLTITWSSPIGSFPNGKVGSSVIWKSPSTVGNYTITCTVSDGKETISANIDVAVEAKVPAPQIPNLVYPVNGQNYMVISPTVKWEKVENTVSYSLQLSKSYSFLSSDIMLSVPIISDTVYAINGLDKSTTYYWRVNSTNSSGTSSWSSIWSFTIGSYGTPCPGTLTVTYEGKTYNTVQVGTQCWLKENLDVGVYKPSAHTKYVHSDVTNDGIIEKYCYGNNEANCGTYGGLYDWNEAMAYSTTPGTKGICPTGWHIPTRTEFETLRATVGNDGNKLKREDQGTGSGVGTNTSGFSALLAGGRADNGGFGTLGYSTNFWGYAEPDGLLAYNMYLWGDGSDLYMLESYKIYGYSIRCLKD
ncbi:MAG: FISUMP domain-containing protein [Ignavibacteria bacterium]|nr:FISUMP domain-containing protein [Ignavibacteria bacterium]